ncbi:MAG: hypothetical protein PF447_06820 [Spirochaetaceae bacterium]|nr:hypothetical protein [Spirochaetaceae bacterium]
MEYPWGENPTGYSVWISEIMLQQTQVKAVIPYFLAWMREYPSIESLAQASEEEVMRSWEGLGYYSRARNIHKTSKHLFSLGQKELPKKYDELLALPGIGPYTAAAICSIAFGLPHAVLDANVKRLCQRWGAHEDWTAREEKLWTTRLDSIIKDISEPGLFNCALMQLGQLVCKKSNPQCEICPVSINCKAYQQGRTAEIPKVKKKSVKMWDSWALIYRSEDKILMEYRDSGIGRGLWSFPRISKEEPLPRGWRALMELKPLNHAFTTNRERLYPVVLEREAAESMGTLGKGVDVADHGLLAAERGGYIPGGSLPGVVFSTWEWVSLDQLRDRAVPAVYRRMILSLGG